MSVGLVRRLLTGDTAAPGMSQEQRTLAVLGSARALIERGWLQGAWYVLEGADGGRELVLPGALTLRRNRAVVQACLVGAIAEAEHRHTPRRDVAGAAIDALWQTLREDEGRSFDPERYVPSPSARALRARDLARWNDDPARTRDDVLRLLDRTMHRLGPCGGGPAGATPDPIPVAAARSSGEEHR